MGKSLNWDEIKTRLDVIIAVGAILTAAVGFLFKQGQWGILVALAVLVCGLLAMHLLRVTRMDEVTYKKEKVFRFAGRPRIYAAVSLVGILLILAVLLFIPSTSHFIQTVFWDREAMGTMFLSQTQYESFEFSGDANPPQTGSAYLTVSNSYFNFRSSPAFQFDYTLPESNSNSYAGVTISLNPQVDASKYQNIAFRMRFTDQPGRIRISLKDTLGNDSAVLTGDGRFSSTGSGQAQEISIPFSEFPDVATMLLKEIVFSVDGTISNGQGGVRIENIRFTK